MTSNTESKSKPSLGFLTVVEHPQFGLFGGYLILNLSGRPLEFHCTAPIKPNRAQEILYGPTLQDFLYGEQIGQTLIHQASIPPLLICTDQAPALAAREYVTMPIALVIPSVDGNEIEAQSLPPVETSGRVLRVDGAHLGGPQMATFRLGRNRLAVPEKAQADHLLIVERLGEWAESFDLAEPFQRIRDAIEEAQQAVR